MKTIKYDSISSKSFFLNDVNDIKVQKLYNKANAILVFKNEVSKKIFDNVFFFIEQGVNYSKKLFKSDSKYLNAQDEQNAIEDVIGSYVNKSKNLGDKLNIYKITLTPIYYKVNGKTFKKGTIKNFICKKSKTKTSMTLSFLSKFKSNKIEAIDYIKNEIIKMNESDEKDKVVSRLNFYNDMIYVIDKFGIERLMVTANLKRETISRKYFNKPHEFKSLNFRSCSRINKPIVEFNKNNTSKIDAFINIGGFLKEISDEDFEIIKSENKILKENNKNKKQLSSETLSFPFSYSKKYHGNLLNYDNQTVGYTVVFSNYNKNISISLTKNIKRQVVVGGNNNIGVDVNIKNNLFSTSSEHLIDYDRELLSDYIKFRKEIEEKQKYKKKIKLKPEEVSRLSTKDFKKQQKFIRKIESDLRLKAKILVDYAIKNGFNNIVMEWLGQMEKGFSRNEEFEGVKYSSLWKILRIQAVSEFVKLACYKQNISLSLVHAEYSSQCCNECYHVSRDNRKNQENFECVECGHKDLADFNSPKNLKNVVEIDVLSQNLLTTTKFEETIPRKISRDVIKQTLTNYSESLRK
jgi:hypothetical protein